MSGVQDQPPGGPRRPRGRRAAPERVLGRVAEGLVSAGSAAERVIESARRLRPGGRRLADLRRASRRPLPSLVVVHPEARRAPRRSLGLLTIPVASIAGTAVEGASQRGGDFLPLPPLRTRNWKARWQRLRAAQERLAVLPPIDVLQTADGYWVVDGHNRVAAALYGGQDDIDAIVTHVHLTGDPEPRTEAGAVAAGLVDAADLKAAGAGRLARGATVRPRRIARSEGPGEVGR